MSVEAGVSIQIDQVESKPSWVEGLTASSLLRTSDLLERTSLVLGRVRRLGLSTTSGILVIGAFIESPLLLEIGGITLLLSSGVSYIQSRVRSNQGEVKTEMDKRRLKFVIK